MTTQTRARRRPSAWSYVTPVALLVAALAAAWVWPFFASPGAVRAATPVAGPGDTINLPMRVGVDYLIYHDAKSVDVGRDCRFGTAEHTVGRLGIGGIARSDVAYRGVAGRVTDGGHTYELAMRLTNRDDREVAVSCAGGGVLAEAMPAYSPVALAAAGVAGAIVIASALVVALSRRRRPDDVTGDGPTTGTGAIR